MTRLIVQTPASCGGCTRKWLSNAHAHCTRCHAHFSSVTTFDMHLRGGGHHRPEDLRDSNGYRQLKLKDLVGAGGAVWVSVREPVS